MERHRSLDGVVRGLGVVAVAVAVGITASLTGSGGSGPVHQQVHRFQLQGRPAAVVPAPPTHAGAPPTHAPAPPTHAAAPPTPAPLPPVHLPPALATPAGTALSAGWHPVARRVRGRSAVYEAALAFPGQPADAAGLAWMDASLLRARLYSGSLSPGGLQWAATAPVSPLAAESLVAAFNGGFLLKDSHGGYLSEGKLVAPLRPGAASLVFYAGGGVTVGQWGRDVSMSPSVVAVRQNLTLLVDQGAPVAGLSAQDAALWGYALGNRPDVWRSGVGVTRGGDLVYAAGPMNIVELADALVAAGAVRAMELDMNPLWTVFATYAPAASGGPAAAGNGTDLLPGMVQSPARFFSPSYARDFITMSAS